jgi:hypothetical protein
MIKRRVAPAQLSTGLAGDLLLGALFGLNLQTTNRTDIVAASGKKFVGPTDDACFIDLGAIFDGTRH